MSDLRDAQLRQEFRAEIMRGYQAALCNGGMPDTGWTLGDEVAKVADNLLATVAAHPVEPAPIDIERAVRAGAEVLDPSAFDGSDPHGDGQSGQYRRDVARQTMRAALEAALPHLQEAP